MPPTEADAAVQVQWIDPQDPGRGFEYLYLTDATHQAYLARLGRDGLPYAAQEIPAETQFTSTFALGTDRTEREPRWRLTDIVGEEDGLGVECLSGSGAIAAAFSRAYDEGFTLTYVSGRTVGIGAYLARLGHRCARPW